MGGYPNEKQENVSQLYPFYDQGSYMDLVTTPFLFGTWTIIERVFGRKLLKLMYNLVKCVHVQPTCVQPEKPFKLQPREKSHVVLVEQLFFSCKCNDIVETLSHWFATVYVCNPEFVQNPYVFVTSGNQIMCNPC